MSRIRHVCPAHAPGEGDDRTDIRSPADQLFGFRGDVAQRFDGRDVPRPPRWGGFRTEPSSIEFWYGADYRLHERQLYERAPDGGWSRRMLYP